MKYFKVEKKVDGRYSLNPFEFVKGAEAIKNILEARLRIIKGELRYNVNLGIPITHNKNDIDLSISNTILDTPGVKEITKFVSKIDNERKYSATVYVKTNDNEMISVEV